MSNPSALNEEAYTSVEADILADIEKGETETAELKPGEPAEANASTNEATGDEGDDDAANTDVDDPGDGQSNDGGADNKLPEQFQLNDGDELAYVDPDSGEEILVNELVERFHNDAKFTKANTEKAMQIAKERADFKELANTLQHEDVQKLLVDEEFLVAMDTYCEEEGMKNNPFRSTEGIVEAQGKIDQAAADELAPHIQAEILQLKRDVPEYKKEEAFEALIDVAKGKGVPLLDADRIMRFEAVEKDLADTRKELKARNAELSKLKKGKHATGATERESGGKGASKTDYAKPAADYDEAEKRILAEIGVSIE